MICKLSGCGHTLSSVKPSSEVLTVGRALTSVPKRRTRRGVMNSIVADVGEEVLDVARCDETSVRLSTNVDVVRSKKVSPTEEVLAESERRKGRCFVIEAFDPPVKVEVEHSRAVCLQ